MYVTQIALYGNKRYPLALGLIYNVVAEYYKLPDLKLLQASARDTVQWPVTTPPLQVYYLDSLTEASDKDIFQVRFGSSKDARDLISLFVSFHESQVQNMTFVFPGRTGRGAASIVIGSIKSAAHQLSLNANDLDFAIEGFTEVGLALYIREHSLTAFVWIEPLNRYLHFKEDPGKIQDVRKGRRQL